MTKVLDLLCCIIWLMYKTNQSFHEKVGDDPAAVVNKTCCLVESSNQVLVDKAPMHGNPMVPIWQSLLPSSLKINMDAVFNSMSGATSLGSVSQLHRYDFVKCPGQLWKNRGTSFC